MAETAKTVFWVVAGVGALYVGYYTWLCAKDKGLLVCLIEKTASSGVTLLKDLWNEGIKPGADAIGPEYIADGFKDLGKPEVWKEGIEDIGKQKTWDVFANAFTGEDTKRPYRPNPHPTEQWNAWEAAIAKIKAEKEAKKNK